MGESYRPALMTAYVEDDPSALRTDAQVGGLQLRPAVAAQRMEHVASEALGVHAHQDPFAVADLPQHHRDVDAAVDEALVGVGPEVPVLRRYGGLRDLSDQPLTLSSK